MSSSFIFNPILSCISCETLMCREISSQIYSITTTSCNGFSSTVNLYTMCMSSSRLTAKKRIYTTLGVIIT